MLYPLDNQYVVMNNTNPYPSDMEADHTRSGPPGVRVASRGRANIKHSQVPQGWYIVWHLSFLLY
jgi:hypothetical protein